MITLQRTESTDADFLALIQKLDEYLAEKDGEETMFYRQFNKVDLIKHVVVAYVDGVPAGCGAFKQFRETTAEIKRLYVDPVFRRRQIARTILNELEEWAYSLGYSTAVLETGKRQEEAVILYQQCGYTITSNYGQYIGVENSICMEKPLKKKPAHS